MMNFNESKWSGPVHSNRTHLILYFGLFFLLSRFYEECLSERKSKKRVKENEKYTKYEMKSYNSVHQNDNLGKSVDV